MKLEIPGVNVVSKPSEGSFSTQGDVIMEPTVHPLQ
jgi:hypothetical protein